MTTRDDVNETTSLLSRQRSLTSSLTRQPIHDAEDEEISALPDFSSNVAHRRTVRSASAPHVRATYMRARSMSIVKVEDTGLNRSAIPDEEKEDLFGITFAILFSVMLERCTYFSVVGNLVLFCTSNLVVTSTEAVTINLFFTGLAFIVPIFAGRIADTLVNRYNTIYACYLVYLLGAVILPVIAFDYVDIFGHDSHGHPYGMSLATKKGFFAFAIICVAIGAGGIKANISPFGAQQVKKMGQESVQSFFNWFYWFVNFGGFIAYIGVVYVQQELGFFYGYLIPTLTLLVSLILFTIPRQKYHVVAAENVFGFIFAMLWEGSCSHRCLCCRKSQDESVEWTPGYPKTLSDLPVHNPNSSPRSDTSDLCEMTPPVSSTPEPRPTKWLDRAKVSFGGSFEDEEVDNVKSLIKTLPVFLTLILFSTFTSQTTTTMFLQGERMNPQLGSFTVPAAMLNVFKMIIIIMLLPILDRIIYPALQKFDKRPSLLQRIGFGMLVGVIALGCMGTLEIYRKEDLRTTGGRMVHVGKAWYNASDISIMWQVPQFLFTGVGDAFCLVTALEFSYTESPVSTQGLMMGINHLMTGLGNLFASLLYNTVASATLASGDPWLPNELNDGYLERYIFLLAGMLFINLLCFICIARQYTYNQLGVVTLKRDILEETPAILRPKSKSIVEHLLFER